MARINARRKGKSGSTRPIDRKKHPDWSSLNPREVEARIAELAKLGKSTSEIGMILEINMPFLMLKLQQIKEYLRF